MVLLFSLLLQNNWYMYVHVYATLTGTDWSYLYFIVNWFVGVLLILNLVRSFVLNGFWDTYRRQRGLGDDESKSRVYALGGEGGSGGERTSAESSQRPLMPPDKSSLAAEVSPREGLAAPLGPEHGFERSLAQRMGLVDFSAGYGPLGPAQPAHRI